MTISLDQLIFKKEKILSKDECEILIQEYEARNKENVLEHCAEATTKVDTYSSFKRIDLKRGTETYNIIHRSTEKMINDYLDYLDSFDMFHVMLRDSMLFSHMYRLLKYETGAKIHPHTDHDTHVYGSCTFNLNDNYTGGEFTWWKGKHSMPLSAGDGLIFPADFFWVHEVKPITSGVRYSTNSFLLDVPDSVRNELTKIKSMFLSTSTGTAIDSKIKNDLKTIYNIKKKFSSSKVN